MNDRPPKPAFGTARKAAELTQRLDRIEQLLSSVMPLIMELDLQVTFLLQHLRYRKPGNVTDATGRPIAVEEGTFEQLYAEKRQALIDQKQRHMDARRLAFETHSDDDLTYSH